MKENQSLLSVWWFKFLRELLLGWIGIGIGWRADVTWQWKWVEKLEEQLKNNFS